MEKNDYMVVETEDGDPLNRGVLDMNLFCGMIFKEGLCAGDYQTSAPPRDRQTYLEEVLKPLVAEGKINIKEVRDETGKIIQYDDRKFRFAGFKLDWSEAEKGSDLVVKLGDSHFLAFRADRRRSDEENYAIQTQALREQHDKWAYHQRNPGVAGLIFSATGSAYVGKRTNEEDMGSLNSVAGHLSYREDVEQVDITKDLDKECREEFGVLPENIVERIFVGAYGHPAKGDFDFTYLVKTNLPEAHFAADGAWKKLRKTEEHEELIRLATPSEVARLLESGRIGERNEKFAVMYSTRGALESLRDGDFESYTHGQY